MRRLFPTIASLSALLLSAPALQASVIDVTIQNFQFTGQHLTIQLGDSVRWTNLDGMTHTSSEGTDLIVNGNEAWHHVFPPGSPSWSVVFDAAFLAANPRPGNRYDYFCAPHPSMRGSITVVDGPGTPFCFCSPIGPCSNRDYGAGCSWVGNDRGGRLLGSGSTSVMADDLQLVADLLPPNRTCIAFRGTSQLAQTQMGEGWRCIGAPLYRFSVQNSGPTGVLALGPGIVAFTSGSAAPILAGQTWQFQVQYQDVTSPCGHAGNVSNGYLVTFTP